MDQLTFSSPAFSEGSTIPREFTCEGSDISPALEWKGVPETAQSIALVCIDPDAPMGDWIHWVVWNIPGDWTGLKEAIDPKDQTPFAQGRNSWGVVGYGGPCPPKGHGPHRYYFRLYCLDIPNIDLPPNGTWQRLEKAMKNHILATAETMGRYERK